MQKIISIIVPVHNEEKNIPLIKGELLAVLAPLPYSYEIIFINDGSTDSSQEIIEKLSDLHSQVKCIEFSRNFGKEAATSAGLLHAVGDAVIIIDADLQHPPSTIHCFIEAWENGADVVIGRRSKNAGQSWVKSLGSDLYYKIINSISSTPIEKGGTDFRLLDRKVVDAFNTFTEHERITRGLIDWLGFRREFVEFEALERVHGVASYSYLKLTKLALSSFVAHSLFPLKFAGYLGLFIMTVSGVSGLAIFLERYVFGDVLRWEFSGPAELAILMIFFIGIILSCLGLVALYVGNIHNEVSGRPLYVVRSRRNIGLLK